MIHCISVLWKKQWLSKSLSKAYLQLRTCFPKTAVHETDLSEGTVDVSLTSYGLEEVAREFEKMIENEKSRRKIYVWEYAMLLLVSFGILGGSSQFRTAPQFYFLSREGLEP